MANVETVTPPAPAVDNKKNAGDFDAVHRRLTWMQHMAKQRPTTTEEKETQVILMDAATKLLRVWSRHQPFDTGRAIQTMQLLHDAADAACASFFLARSNSVVALGEEGDEEEEEDDGVHDDDGDGSVSLDKPALQRSPSERRTH
jgi:hypothetical protein